MGKRRGKVREAPSVPDGTSQPRQTTLDHFRLVSGPELASTPLAGASAQTLDSSGDGASLSPVERAAPPQPGREAIVASPGAMVSRGEPGDQEGRLHERTTGATLQAEPGLTAAQALEKTVSTLEQAAKAPLPVFSMGRVEKPAVVTLETLWDLTSSTHSALQNLILKNMETIKVLSETALNQIQTSESQATEVRRMSEKVEKLDLVGQTLIKDKNFTLRRLEYLENYSKRLTLRFINFPRSPMVVPIQMIRKYLMEILGMPENSLPPITRAYYIQMDVKSSENQQQQGVMDLKAFLESSLEVITQRTTLLVTFALEIDRDAVLKLSLRHLDSLFMGSKVAMDTVSRNFDQSNYDFYDSGVSYCHGNGTNGNKCPAYGKKWRAVQTKKCKSNRINQRKLLRTRLASSRLTPSAFLKEMSLTTEQKLALPHEMHPPRIIQLLDISETSFQKFSTVDVDQTLFQPFPSEIVFQNYVPHETYEVPLVLRNEDRIPRLVKVIQETSPYFKIISPIDAYNKVACGMQSTFRILFTPDENKDYFHEVICVTEREKFVVPIRAIGARAILDFPDQLNFSTCPVKYNCQKTLLVRNIGNREARFQLNTCRPFSAEPSVGTLGIGNSMQMTVEFKPQYIGDHSEDLVINYDTGENIYVRLYGAAIDINIRLDKNSLLLEKTFISMANQRMVTIINRSDIIAHFQWKAFATQEEEDQEKFRLCFDLHSEEEDETDRFLEECGSDPSLRERLSILTRTFYNRRKMIQADSMLFSDDIFMIEPVVFGAMEDNVPRHEEYEETVVGSDGHDGNGKRKCAPKFTEDELQVLVHRVCDEFGRLFKKSRLSLGQKNKIWRKIADDVTAVGVQMRTVEQCVHPVAGTLTWSAEPATPCATQDEEEEACVWLMTPTQGGEDREAEETVTLDLVDVTTPLDVHVTPLSSAIQLPNDCPQTPPVEEWEDRRQLWEMQAKWNEGIHTLLKEVAEHVQHSTDAICAQVENVVQNVVSNAVMRVLEKTNTHLSDLCNTMRTNSQQQQQMFLDLRQEIRGMRPWTTSQPTSVPSWTTSAALPRIKTIISYLLTGREARLPLRIKGEGIGPRLLFNFDQLDIGKVFVGSVHGYEAVLANKGYIDAIFTLIPPATALGTGFMFNPSEGIILPGGHQVIEITFSSSKLGDFTEVFMFNVDGSSEPVSLTIRGCVIGPTFHFSTPALHFGDVSFGFPYTLNCSLNNTSLVPLSFNLRIPGDGPGDPSTTCSSLILDNRNTVWGKGGQGGIKPKEFTIIPSHGTVRPQGFLNIQVTLCSNTVKIYELAMMVDVESVGEEVLALPITARCLVPLVRVEKPVMKFGRCFLQYPYKQSVKLVNDSNLPGCYSLTPEEPHSLSTVFYSSPSPRGLIDPYSSVAIPLVLEAQIIGVYETKVHICIFGSKESTLEVNLQYAGVGPVVCVKPIELDFGKIQVLTEVSRTLQLSNQSCIPAHFLAQMVRSHSYWSVEPSEGVIPPGTDLTLTLVAKLDDTVKFFDKLQLVIVNSNTYTIPVQAKGIGNTILTDRPFASGLNLGIHFGGTVCTYHFTMTNYGRRTYQLYWLTEGFPLINKSSQCSFPTTVKNKNSPNNLEPPNPVFKLTPFRMELNPGQSMDMVVEGSSEAAKVVKETLLCHAIIGKSSVKELIMKVDVTCEFIAPILYLSDKELKYSIKKLSDDVLPLQYQPLIIKNISSLPLSILLFAEEPFCVCDKDQKLLSTNIKPIKLRVGEETEISIRFNPNFLSDMNCRVAEDMLTIQYVEHPQKEFVILYGEVHFPSLDFQSTKVDFGCILNDTEVIQYVQMTNNSLLPVKYRWSFLTNDWENQIRFHSGERKSFSAEPAEQVQSNKSVRTHREGEEQDWEMDSNQGDEEQLREPCEEVEEMEWDKREENEEERMEVAAFAQTAGAKMMDPKELMSFMAHQFQKQQEMAQKFMEDSLAAFRAQHENSLVASQAQHENSLAAAQAQHEDSLTATRAQQQPLFDLLQEMLRAGGIPRRVVPSVEEVATGGTCGVGEPGTVNWLPWGKLAPGDDIEDYLGTFERVAVAAGWPLEQWTIRLAPALSGAALAAFRGLSPAEVVDYERLKGAILDRYGVSKHTYRRRFKSWRWTEGDTPRALAQKLMDLANKWWNLTRERRCLWGQEVKELENDLGPQITEIFQTSEPQIADTLGDQQKEEMQDLLASFQDVNALSIPDAYPMPRIDELLDRLGTVRYLSTLDLTKGYWQIPLTAEARPKTAFATPLGLYQFRRMPFGLNSAAASCQRLLDKVLRPHQEYVAAYLDDVDSQKVEGEEQDWEMDSNQGDEEQLKEPCEEVEEMEWDKREENEEERMEVAAFAQTAGAKHSSLALVFLKPSLALVFLQPSLTLVFLLPSLILTCDIISECLYKAPVNFKALPLQQRSSDESSSIYGLKRQEERGSGKDEELKPFREKPQLLDSSEKVPFTLDAGSLELNPESRSVTLTAASLPQEENHLITGVEEGSSRRQDQWVEDAAPSTQQDPGLHAAPLQAAVAPGQERLASSFPLEDTGEKEEEKVTLREQLGDLTSIEEEVEEEDLLEKTSEIRLQLEEANPEDKPVFDILPLYGVLQPGESQQVAFTFFGHANINIQAKALCTVEAGPTYEIMLYGEASLVSYVLSTKEVDCGLQLLQHARTVDPEAGSGKVPKPGPESAMAKKTERWNEQLGVQVNALSILDAYPMPRIDELLDRLGTVRYLSTLDLTKGYWQIPLTAEARPKTAFATPLGLYQFRRMPFGLNSAAASCQRLLDKVLRPHQEYVAAYLDDVADASGVGLGAVLSQVHERQEHPLMYLSKKLLPHERHYSTIERECLATKWAIQMCHFYLDGRSFTLDSQKVEGEEQDWEMDSNQGDEEQLKEPCEEVEEMEWDKREENEEERMEVAAFAQTAGAKLPILPQGDVATLNEENHLITGVEEVFDILPLYGVLQPGESQQVAFTFFGHANINIQAKALCTVEAGPTYEIMLYGEASLVSYVLSTKEVDCGLQLFDELFEAEVVLRNTGKVGFDFTLPNSIEDSSSSLLPGEPLILPSSGHIDSGGELILQIWYLPGVPEAFFCTFQVQVAHLEPEDITLKGEGIFPRICLDLPRNIKKNKKYKTFLDEAKRNLQRENKMEESLSRPMTNAGEANVDDFFINYDTLLQMEVERLLIKEYALQQQAMISSNNTVNIQWTHKKLVKISMPDYLLDFGYVILGHVRTHIIKITNTGHLPVSFYIDRKTLTNTGFSMELDRVKNLPYCETETFEVKFDPQSANLPLEDVQIAVPIQVVGGPIFPICLRASVTMPTLTISCDKLDFSCVQCGQCKMKSLQLHNVLHVACEWSINPPETIKNVASLNLLHHRSRKRRQNMKPKTQVFEMMPYAGVLLPGQRINVQVKFMPLEEKYYSQRLVLHISQSSQRLTLLVQGQGLEPQLDFSPTMLELGPVLPFSPGDEMELLVKNPCSFPIEFYSLEHDKQYLEEEKILQMVKGYDSNNTLLLPARFPGEKLPQELLEFYEEQKTRERETKIQENDHQFWFSLAGIQVLPCPMSKRGIKGCEKQHETLFGTEKSRLSMLALGASESMAQPKPDQSINADSGPDISWQILSAPGSLKKHWSSSQVPWCPSDPFPPHERHKSSPEKLSFSEFVREMAKPVPFDLETESRTDTLDIFQFEEPRKEAVTVLMHGSYIIQRSDEINVKEAGELDNNPVSRAIARYLGIDITPEGRAAMNRKGIAIVVHGSPLSGKTNLAVALAKYYGSACLSIDSVVLEAISAGNTSAGLEARKLCMRAALEKSQRDMEEGGLRPPELLQGTGGLSMEAVAKHTAEGTQVTENKTAPQSNISKGNKTSTGGGKIHAVQGSRQQQLQSDLATSQVTSSPFIGGPVPCRISVSASVAGESGLMSCVLPTELLVEILAERMQLSDCFQGVVFDGMETLFARNFPSALLCLLKAINNRNHIYFVSLNQEYEALKDLERAKREAEEVEQESIWAKERARLEEMDEDEYEALSGDERAWFDEQRLKAVRERKKRAQERLAQEKKLKEALRRRQEEDEMRRKGKRVKKDSAKEELAGKKGQSVGKQVTIASGLKPDTRQDSGMEKRISIRDRPDSVLTEAEEANKKKKFFKGHSTDPALASVGYEELDFDSLDESEKQLIQKFKNYEYGKKEVTHILTFWDRMQGIVNLLSVADENQHEEEQMLERQAPSGKKGKKDRERERLEKEKAEKERVEKEKAEKERQDKLKAIEETKALALQAFVTKLEGDGAEHLEDVEPEKNIKLGVPHLEFMISGPDDPRSTMVLESGKLPSLDEVLDGLGLGPSGPPIPPDTLFSVVPYPVKRKPLRAEDILEHFTFITSPSPEDPSMTAEEKKELEPEVDHIITPLLKEEPATPTKSRLKKDKQDSGTERQKDKRRSASVKKSLSSQENPFTPPRAVTPVSGLDHSSVSRETVHEKFLRLSNYRWIVPPNESVSIRIHFASLIGGQYDQTLNFEIMGTQRLYQVYCRGICSLPTISQDPKIVFPHRKKEAKPEEIIQKKYVIQTETFHFGPLLCGKSRERYKSGQFPENMEKITIYNTSPIVTELFFCFQHDVKAITFILEPPNMTLNPYEKQELSVWAYPTTTGIIEDNIVCCIKDNPEPAIFKICCHGVRPELELDRKQLHFDRILMHRKDTKTLFLRNSTLLGVAWRITGMDNLGDDFVLSQDQGIILPRSEFSLQIHFRGTKAVNIKRFIRLEVSDVQNILGIVQIENIQILAEAYDIALDISFPKGTEGGLDFGIIKVLDEAKQIISLKNKGKYEIGFSFSLDTTDPSMRDLNSIFSIIPQKGILMSNERPTQVQIVFRSKKEILIIEKPILRCQVIEPNISEGGETIASIPVKVSVQSVCTKYKILPSSGINFGAMIMGTRKLCSFTIENQGKIEFKFTISKTVNEVTNQQIKKSAPPTLKRISSREGSSSSKSVQPGKGKRGEIQKDSNVFAQARFLTGMFTVSPGFGNIPPGGNQSIMVECHADLLGKSEEFLAIDISDRDPTDQPNGIPYGLVTEGCIPAFVTDDIAAIFEEHRICKNINLYPCLQTLDSEGLYLEDENKFIFTNILVGHLAKARFKIINAGKVPCDVVLSVKSTSPKTNFRISDIFEVDPTRISIPSHSHAFATVTFSPMMMQSYSCVFEALVDGASSLVSKARHLTFEISGEGNLPRVSILRPVLRNKHGNPLLLFKRLLIGHSEKLPLILKNEGTVPAKLHIDLLDDQESFFLKPWLSTHCIYPVKGEEQTDEMTFGTVRKAHTASLILNLGESAEFDVLFKPCLHQRFTATIRLSVLDNQYEESRVQLVGEGYQDDLTLDNIHYLVAPSGIENVEGQLKDDDIEATRMDHFQLGDCHVGKAYDVTFTMTNHNREYAMRFEWPAEAPLRFHPQVGHLHARCSKDITVTLKSEVPVNLQKNVVKCKVSRIAFTVPVDLVPDWDDRLHTVKWVDSGKSPTSQRPTKKKVVETDTEPAHIVLNDNSRELKILISANVNYAQFMCKIENVQFKDTLLFQSRTYKYKVANTGTVQLEFSWKVTVVDSKTFGGPQEFIQSSLKGESPLASAQIASFEGRSSQTASQLGNVLESVSSLLTVGADVPPFSIEPSSGIILARKQQDFLIKFFPKEVGEFEGKLSCSIANLLGDQLYPELKVKGKSLLPYCHFELEDSDYITENRRNPELRGPQGEPPRTPLDPNTRVIEFSNVGIHTKTIRSFMIINPTNSAYSFVWTCKDTLSLKSAPAFNCLTMLGQIRAEKKAEITFEFMSQEMDIVESFWTFTIPEQNISVPFLLVGNTTEPSVSLDRSHLNFLSRLVGHEAQAVVYLVNNEERAFAFSFRENSRFSEGFLSCLVVKPMEGDILPLSRIPITILFTPTIEGEVNFNLICDVKNKMQPLTLNVKADGFIMDASITCEEKYGATVTLDAQKTNEINFKQVEVNDMTTWQLNIMNNGNFGFNFDCKITAPKQLQHYLTIVPEKGLIEGWQHTQTMLTFHPLQKCTLKDAQLKIKISNGPTFTCLLLGSAAIPSIHFSFMKHDFRSCFIYHAGMPCNKRSLVITNKDDKEISIDCLFINTAYLEVEFQAEVLLPGDKMEVPITFYPREAIQYHEKLCFEINGHSQQTIEIFGKGAEMKIEVLNPRHKVVNFGALQVGQSVKRVVPIVNNSAASLTFSVAITPTMQALHDPKVLTLCPSMEITLKPQDTWKVEVTFSPKSRIQSFAEEVMLEHVGLSRCLFVIRGCSHGIEISLDQDNIPFGAAVLQSHVVRRIVMFNTGDIGARFNWDIKTFQPDFSISPTEGYITPGMEVAFQVTFHPYSLKQNILYENLKCFIEGSKPLKLTLSGSGVGIPAVKEVLNFQCVVRGRQTQTILLANRTNSSWNLKPIIEGEHWTGHDSIIVDAQHNKPYEITYQPQIMTSESKHQGSIFFPLPDGIGLVYLLQGVSDPPKSSGNIIREIPCKTSYNELLTVTNWLNRAQRFHVFIEFLKPDKIDPTTIIKGLDYHEVPASSKRDYKLTFFSHKEGLFNIKVTFRNETTQEYIFYFVTFKATPPGIISTIEMVAPVRQTITATLKVENPLSIPVTFNIDCKVPEINSPPHFTVPAQSEGSLVFEYQPLKVGETTGRLTLMNNELGIFQYELILKAMPAKPEKPIYFCTALGSSQVLSVKFMNYIRQKSEYSCKIDSSDFHVEKIIHAAPAAQGGTELSVEVTYEPSQLGETQAALFISSPTGGDYIFPLVGTSLSPKPQGPIQIRAGVSTTIPFKNIFPQTMVFSFHVDNPLFSIRGSENIRSKKVNNITVSFEGNPSSSKAPITGKLTISCPRTAGTGQGIYWIYYLKGVTPEK
ncbi:hydrocephalus-inducing protein homolog [Microcaecilia unicolor]|uniref:ribonuclease H n=1 Tax=Microcaecilia unicolor TaxID=1415580 RepID=A0A6P7YDH2_9AMPH|nr:hydrocephalus-inducing protein homolog [Microcaecilia unicolor]